LKILPLSIPNGDPGSKTSKEQTLKAKGRPDLIYNFDNESKFENPFLKFNRPWRKRGRLIISSWWIAY